MNPQNAILLRCLVFELYVWDAAQSPSHNNWRRRFQETISELKKGETKHPIIREKNYDEAEGKRAEKRETRVKPIGMLRQNPHILDRFIAAAVRICCRRVLARPM
jgi:hypothetical protein